MKIRNIFNPRRYSGYTEFILLSLRKMHRDVRPSYSQTGEDLLINSAFRFLHISNPTYLDIGAYHPTHLSNTYRFYQQGSQGVCIESNPELAKRLRKKRPRDTVLEVAIGPRADESRGSRYKCFLHTEWPNLTLRLIDLKIHQNPSGFPLRNKLLPMRR
jgi:hypothetical protein